MLPDGRESHVFLYPELEQLDLQQQQLRYRLRNRMLLGLGYRDCVSVGKISNLSLQALSSVVGIIKIG